MDKGILPSSMAMAKQNQEENTKSGLHDARGNTTVLAISGENSNKSGDENIGDVIKSETNIRSNMSSSRLGNGDHFHNPENLVQFVVSGEEGRIK